MPEAYKTVGELKSALAACAQVNGSVKVTDPQKFSGPLVESLVRTAVFADDAAAKDAARWVIRSAAVDLGIYTASIQGLYDAMAAGKVKGLTVPAHNLRGLVFDKARMLFQTARELDAGAFIFEIAKSEMGYCFVRPAEYTSCVLGAAIKEGWKGPVFIQGDHFQFAAKDYFKDPEKVTAEIKSLTREAIEGGYLNIDIDPSTLVLLERPNVKEQQRDNYERAAEMTEFIRKHQPPGVDVSVGGEIGEVGQKNSTVEEFEAYFEGYRERYRGKPISKMSVQTGTSHGGVVLADGSRAKVDIDFKILKDITAACRRHGVGGTVQHGASTLPEDLFAEFPKHDAIEIHLATEFQRLVFDHPKFPRDLRAKMEKWVHDTRPPEWKEANSPAQNFEKCAKRAWGPHKKDLWDMPRENLNPILETLRQKFTKYFKLLNAGGSRKVVNEFVKPVPVVPPKPAGL